MRKAEKRNKRTKTQTAIITSFNHIQKNRINLIFAHGYLSHFSSLHTHTQHSIVETMNKEQRESEVVSCNSFEHVATRLPFKLCGQWKTVQK